MPVLVILTRYHGDESNSKWGQGQRGGSSDRNFAPDPEYIWIYEYLTRLHLCVCVFIQIYETNKHGTKLILMRIANFDSPLWHNSFWRSRLFVIVCCCVWWLWLSIWNIAKKALLSQTLAALTKSTKSKPGETLLKPWNLFHFTQSLFILQIQWSQILENSK